MIVVRTFDAFDEEFRDDLAAERVKFSDGLVTRDAFLLQDVVEVAPDLRCNGSQVLLFYKGIFAPPSGFKA